MWKPLAALSLLGVIGLTLCAGFYVVFWTDSQDLRKFKQIRGRHDGG